MGLVGAVWVGSNGTLQAQDAPERVLLDDMEDLQKDFRRLRQAKKPARREATLAAVVTMQESTLAAKLKAPHTDGLSDKEKAEFLLGYRLEMIKLAQALLDVEKFVLQEKYAEAEKAYKVVEGIRRDGHNRYQRME